MKKNLAVSSLVVLAAACGTAPKDATTVATSDEPVCAKEERVGTMFRSSVCRTSAELEKNRQDAKRWDTERLRPATTNDLPPSAR
jgi:hypothetical protein